MVRKLRQQFLYSFRPGLLDICGNFTVVAGAVGTTDIKGVTSVTRTGAGAYTVLFDQPYLGLVSASALVLHEGIDAYHSWLVEDQTEGISGVSSGDGYVKMEVGRNNAAADLTGTVFVSFKVKTSTADA